MLGQNQVSLLSKQKLQKDVAKQEQNRHGFL